MRPGTGLMPDPVVLRPESAAVAPPATVRFPTWLENPFRFKAPLAPIFRLLVLARALTAPS